MSTLQKIKKKLLYVESIKKIKESQIQSLTCIFNLAQAGALGNKRADSSACTVKIDNELTLRSPMVMVHVKEHLTSLLLPPTHFI